MKSTRRKDGYTSLDVFKFTYHYWKQQPIRFAVILASLVAATFIETSMPSALSTFFESIRTHHDEKEVWLKLGVFLAAYFGYTSIFNMNGRVYNVFENNIFRQVYNDAFAHVESLSEQFFVNTFTGSIITTIKRGRDRIETFEDQILLHLFPTCLVLFNSVLLLALRLPMLALVVSMYVLFVIAGSIVLGLRYAGPAQEAYANAQDKFGGQLADCIAGIVTTKSYAQENREIEEFEKLTEYLRKHNLEAYLRGTATALIQRTLLGGMLAILLGGGTWYFIHGRATIDDMAYLVLAYTILQAYVRNVGDQVKSLLTSSYDMHAIVALMREMPSVADKPNAKELTITSAEVCFDSVTFTYPNKDKPVFEKLSVRIKPGERIALVGDSGGGKTSFVRLVQRLYDVDSGSISIDGQNISEVTQASLRSAIALVPQDPILFHRSIKDNIAYGRSDATMEEIRRAAKQANIDDFVMSLSQQYETLVGERGIKLSGGERQRVAIARAILSNRKILILDEATSSLDSVSELAVQDAIHSVTHGRTSIMIAHRLSTIRDADRILVFQDGRIVEEGTHIELSRKAGGVYASFFEIQSGGFIH